MAKIVVGVSGASGIVLAYKAVEGLIRLGWEVELVMSNAACCTALEELGKDLASAPLFVRSLPAELQARVKIHGIKDFGAPIASGSYPTHGMLLIPCSMATLSAVALGLSDNLLRRCADVALKERRPLVIVPRESPFSEIHLENMLRLSRAGATIVPPIPAWYSHPKSLSDVEWTVVGRCLDALKIPNDLYARWGDEAIEKSDCPRRLTSSF